MTQLLRLRHWQVFIFLVAGLLLSDFTIEGNETLTTIISVIGKILYSLWPLVIGHGLYQLLPDNIKFNYNLFLFNAFVWLTANIVFTIISDGEGMKFSGLAALPGFYVFYSILHYSIFPMLLLRTIENGKRADVGQCIGDFFLVILLPIGIWFLQPRINKATERLEETSME